MNTLKKQGMQEGLGHSRLNYPAKWPQKVKDFEKLQRAVKQELNGLTSQRRESLEQQFMTNRPIALPGVKKVLRDMKRANLGPWKWIQLTTANLSTLRFQNAYGWYFRKQAKAQKNDLKWAFEND